MILGKLRTQFEPLSPRKQSEESGLHAVRLERILGRRVAVSRICRKGFGCEYFQSLLTCENHVAVKGPSSGQLNSVAEVFRELPFLQLKCLLNWHRSKDQNKIYLSKNAFLCLFNQEFSLVLLKLLFQQILLSIYSAFLCTLWVTSSEQAQPLSLWQNTNYINLKGRM